MGRDENRCEEAARVEDGLGEVWRDRERREGQGEVGSEGQGAVASDSKRWEGLGRGVEGQREVGRDRER